MNPPVPSDPLSFIKDCLSAGYVRWTYHVSMRLRQRLLKGEILFEGAATLEVIESYPTDKYLPSYLLRGEHHGRVFPVQVATDVIGTNIRVVTMYEPTPADWDPEFRIRRSQP